MAGAMLLGAVLAPTDPVLAGDVQVGPPLEGGEHPVRFALTTEAGLNDGLAFPFVYLALAVAATGGFTSALLIEWLWLDVLYRIAVGVLAGVFLGWLMGKLLFDKPRGESVYNRRCQNGERYDCPQLSLVRQFGVRSCVCEIINRPYSAHAVKSDNASRACLAQ